MQRVNRIMQRCLFAISIISMVEVLPAKNYYVSPVDGNDRNEGTSVEMPFKTLKRLSEVVFMPGDSVLLHTQGIHEGGLKLEGVCGAEAHPIVVSAYDTEVGRRRLARIDASCAVAGVYMNNCRYVEVSRLHITADGGTPDELSVQEKMRCGVLVKVSKKGDFGNIRLWQMKVEDIFYLSKGSARGKKEVRTANGTQPYGWGIRFINSVQDAMLHHIDVDHCEIENVSHTGIKITGKKHNIKNFTLACNSVSRTGGPGIQISGGEDGSVHHNSVTYSGSEDDSRKWGRGSGLWTWSSANVVIEKNQFMYANGPGDSAGAHIDFNCSDIVMQYNLSAYNAGGFCEILGNNYRCMYRYNISVNDGFRRKGKGGAFQEGKTLWTSGYIGKTKPKGPFDSYIYNNTIYAASDILSQMAIGNTTEGLVVANNIIYVKGDMRSVLGDQYRSEKKGESKAKDIMVSNNLFRKIDDWNQAVGFESVKSVEGNPGFVKEGGLCLADYVPTNVRMVKNRGMKIKLPKGVIKADTDILGRKITGKPDLGAIECE